MKKRDWIPFVSLGVAQAALMLGIAGFGFAHLNARLDRIEARLDDLDRRVSRIEGVLRLRPIAETATEPARMPGSDR